MAPQPPLDAVFGERGSLFLTPHLQEGGGGNLQIPTLGEKEELETIWTLLASVSSPQQSKNDGLPGEERTKNSSCLSLFALNFRGRIARML